MSDRFEVQREPLLDEEVWIATSRRGLAVRVVPTKRFSEAAAMVTFRYGSTDLGFDVGGRRHESPEGVAHYLEHKLFEDEEIKAFDRFSRRGARVNAMTGFTRTSYHFTATSEVAANLQDLLHLVSRAHLTEENVEKERGIIAQELRMYEDSPDYRLFFDCIGALYRRHPVRHPVGGTVASIGRIDVAELRACYEAFYCTGNAALAVAGPVDPEAILALADDCALREGAAPVGIRREELDAVDPDDCRRVRALQVPRAKVMLGFKDTTPGGDIEQRLRRELLTDLALDRWFSAASDVREGLRVSGAVDDSLAVGYMNAESFGFSTLTAESDAPEAVVDALCGVVLEPLRIDEEDLDRVRRKTLGRYVRSFGSVRNLAFSQAGEALDALPPFSALQRLASVTPEEVAERAAEHFRADAMAVAIAQPDAE